MSTSKIIQEPFTQIPNRVLRSKIIGPFDKLVYWAIASCNPSFPSYNKLSEWTGLSRDRVYKSIRNLESKKLIKRYKLGSSIYYETHFEVIHKIPEEAIPVRYKD